LRDRDWELAAGEKASFLPALSNQVRLGEALKQPFRLEGLHHHAEVVLLAEEEEVQKIAEREFACRGGDVAAKFARAARLAVGEIDRKSTRLNSSHEWISYAVFCLKNRNKP